jgi:chromosome partitioning protein
VAIVDTDPTQTVYRWSQKEGKPEAITVYGVQDETSLLDAIDEADKTNHLILIDVEGRASVLGNMAMSQSNLVIVPVQPSEPDGFEAAKTIRAIKTAGRALNREIPFCAVMNRLPGAIRTKAFRGMLDQFEAGGVPVAALLTDREAYRRVFNEGGTLFTLVNITQAQEEQIEKATTEAYVFGEKIGLMVGLIKEGGGTTASDEIADQAPEVFAKAAGQANVEAGQGGDVIDNLADQELENMRKEA